MTIYDRLQRVWQWFHHGYIYIDRVIQAPTWGCSWGEFDGYNHGNNLHELGYEARTTSFFLPLRNGSGLRDGSFRSSSMVGAFSYWEWVGGWPSIMKSLVAPKSSKNYQDSCWSLFTWIVFKTPFCWWLWAIWMLQYIYICIGESLLLIYIYIVEWQMLNMLTWVFTNSKSLIWWENVALISIHLRIKDRPLWGKFRRHGTPLGCLELFGRGGHYYWLWVFTAQYLYNMFYYNAHDFALW